MSSESESNVGAEAPPGPCPSCGATNPEDVEKCRNCGEPLFEDVDDAPAARSGEGLASEWRGLVAIAAVFAVAIAGWMLWTPSPPAPSETTAATASQAAAPASGAPKAENEIKEIEIAGDLVWVGTSKGVFAHDRKTGEPKKSLDTAGGLPHEFIDAILVDRSGKLWFAGYGGGISAYDGAQWTHHEPAKTGSRTVVHAFQDREGVYWFGTGGAGLYRFDGQAWTHYTTTNGLPHDEVNTIAQARDGSLWFGTSGGVAHFKDGQWKSYRTADGLVHEKVLVVLIDGEGLKWFGTWGGGLSRFDGSTWKAYPGPPEGPRSPFVLSGRVDDQGRIWFGTYDGVSMKDGETWTHFTSADGLLGADVYAVEIDGDGYKWFGTYKGLSRLDPANKEWKTFLH